MRKIWILAALVILLVSLSISASAASDTYDLPELELQVDIPSEYTVITRDTPENSPIFSQIGKTKAETMKLFEEKKIYLKAISNTYKEEVIVDMVEDDTNSLSMYSDSELLGFAESWVDLFRSLGYPIYKYDIYQHAQTRFIRLYYTNTDQTLHALQYYTVYNNKQINITFRSYEGSLSSRQETTIKTIVDGIQFDNAPSSTVSGEDTKPFVYTDQETGTTFTVPANWKQAEFSEEREFLDVKFASTKEPGYIILYSSSDLWSELTPAEKIGFTREDINNSMLTKELVAQMFSTTPDKVSVVYYNGKSYCKCDIEQTVETAGIKVPVAMTILVYMDNGWLYAFQFGGTSDDARYSDFESLVKSVKYPAVSAETGDDGSNAEYDKDYDTSYNNPGDILLVVLPIVAVVVIGVVIYRKIQEKRQERVLNYGPSAPQAPAATEQRDFCRKCGQLLPSDSVFCHFCGTKIEKES